MYAVNLNSGELKHYGVKGMKWGVTKVGTITVHTNNKFGDKYTDRQKKRMASAAKKLLKREETWDKIYAKGHTNVANRAYKKADKHVWTSEKAQAKGDQQKFEKYQSKAWKQLAKHHSALEAAKRSTESSKLAAKRIADIDSGKLQAGRDFVTNSTYYTNLALDAIGLINVGRTRTLEFKRDGK